MSQGTPDTGRDAHYALLQLLTRLAAAANEARTPAEALQRSLRLIREHGRWTAGHAVTFASGPGPRETVHSFWETDDPERFAGVIEHSSRYVYTPGKGQLLGRCLRERKPVWIADLGLVTAGPRTKLLQALGMRTAFAFPVLLEDEVVAMFEFMSEDVREPDAMLLDHMDYVGGQLSRPIERDRAARLTARLAAIVDCSDDAIISRDLEGRIVSWNKAAERLFGYTAEEAIGRSVTMLIPAGLEGEFARNAQRLAQGRPVMAYETVRLTKDGRLIDVSITQSPVKDEAGRLCAVSIIVRDVTERKKAELAHSQLAAIVESSNDGIVSLDFEGRILSWNASAMRLFGYTADAAIGRHVGLLGPKLASRFAEHTSRLFDAQIIAPQESVCVTRDGAEVSVLVSFSPLMDAAGAVRGASLTFTDISALKAAEKALAESESRFRAAFEQAAVGMGMRGVDPRNPRWLRVNAQLCRILGYTEEELLQLTTLDLTPPEDRALAISYNEDLLKGNLRSYTREKRYVRKDGSVIWINLSLSVAYSDTGEPLYVISVVEDINARKIAEQKVERLTRFYTALSLTNEAIVRIADREALFREVCRIAVRNGRLALAWAGFADEASGSIVPLAFEGPAAAYMAGVRERQRGALHAPRGPASIAIRENRPCVWNDYASRPDVSGEWLADAERHGIRACAVFPLREEGRAVGCLCLHASEPNFFEEDLVDLLGELAQDLSLALDALALRKREREATKALRALNAELEHRVADKTADLERSNRQLAEANEELSAFSYSVSHDIRAPARAIQGFCELILQRKSLKLDADVVRQLRRIEANAVRMGRLVDDLLRLSRISRHEVKKTHFDLNRIVRNCLEALRIEFDLSRVTLRVDGRMPVYGDEALLEIALYQLIANALKYSAQSPSPYIDISAGEAGPGERVYRVSDNGIGFDMKYADKLFHAFQRLHSADEFEGTGIGLTIVQRVVAKHGGRIWAEGVVGGGASFSFVLPAGEAAGPLPRPV